MYKKIKNLEQEVNKVIVGQEYMVRGLILALLSNGHILVNGCPGLAKTLAVKTLSNLIDGKFSRVQFVSDLMPHDILGVEVMDPVTGKIAFRKGPIFANLVLADEINRASPRTQSALLQSMQEREVTVGGETFDLPSDVFMVLATLNPFEMRGTYELPETSIDRFMMMLEVGYPDKDSERRVAVEDFENKSKNLTPIINMGDIVKAREACSKILLSEQATNYIVDLVRATRNGRKDINLGVSPRGAETLVKASRALAFLEGQSHVSPRHIKTLAPDVFRHRILRSDLARQKGITSDEIIEEILKGVAIYGGGGMNGLACRGA